MADLPDDKHVMRVLKALADPKRFRNVQAIAASGELSCGQVCARFPLSQPAISHHLKILSDAELLFVREQGQHRFISVNRKLLQSVLRLLSSRMRFKASGRRSRTALSRSHSA